MIRPALFLDRDGVVNTDYGYVHKAENFKFVDGIFELVAAANRQGYLVVIVTNQAGIGRGYYSETEFHSLTDWMKSQFIEESCLIDAVYFCPSHPEHGIGKYRRTCNCRKPAPGLLLQAQQDLNINMFKSIIVGDKLSDMAAGRSAAVGTLLYLNDAADGDGCLVIRQISEAIPYLYHCLDRQLASSVR